ncbi:hypothetical protein [Fructobacillus tropaeoli]|uniref:hypothetical protein n=1 Tax=Fructobacillus tropaeoli TaxID=709323 RepID=UPI0019403C26|nr:hypothetical protein [Fructobacillus tropaeoli]GIC69557.1 hypothetical protein FT12353_01940 [Fructobacillus tropaeoli]
MNFNEIEQSFNDIKNNYSSVIQALIGIGLIEEYPELSFNDSYSRYDVNDYRQIYNDLNLSRSCVNWLIQLTNKNGFITNDGEELQPIDLINIDLIEADKLFNYYNEKLQNMQDLLNQLRNILVENNVISK